MMAPRSTRLIKAFVVVTTLGLSVVIGGLTARWLSGHWLADSATTPSDLGSGTLSDVHEVVLDGVARGATAHATFRWQNTGQAPVSIERITRDCACFDVQYDRTPIRPGESTLIRIAIFVDDQAPAIVRHSLALHLSGSSARVVPVTLVARTAARFPFHLLPASGDPGEPYVCLTR